MFAEPLLSNIMRDTFYRAVGLVTMREAHKDRLMVGIYVVRRSDGLNCHDTIQTKFR
jgi:hypothetical protein